MNIHNEIGKINEFMQWSKQELNALKKNQEHMLDKLDVIQKNHWINYGKITAIVALTELFLKGVFKQ